MGGGLMQLVAYGAQDIYLTGNPQITFFKVVYRRHTNFSMEEIAQTPNGSVSFSGTASYTISRNGDLVHKMYFEFSPKKTLESVTAIDQAATGIQAQLTTYVGNTILKEIECEIGGQKIDRHYGHWLSTWADLTERNPTGEIAQISSNVANGGDNTTLAEPGTTYTGAAVGTKTAGSATGNGGSGGRPTKYQRMSFNHLGLGHSDENNSKGAFSANSGPANILPDSTLPTKSQVPLRFWFNRNPGLALPLIALQYHEVKINIKFCEAKDIFSQTATGGAITAAGANHSLSEGKLFVQYIYLDTDERRRFAQVSHEYLIEQLQFQNETGNGSTFTLNFNHPVKEIIWGGSPLPTGTCSGANVTAAAPPVSGPTVLSPFKAGNNPGTDNTSVLAAGFTDSMNGSIDYNFSTQGGNAVNSGTWQLKLNGHDRFEPRPITYFSRQQIYDHHTGFGCIPSKDSILVYSFALKPEEHQPSGTCNFSRIDTAQLIAQDVGVVSGIYIYAVNYNVLRIMSGMGGLAYSN